MNRQVNETATNWQPAAGTMILAQGAAVPFDDMTTGRNDNVLVVGGSGTGKTRGIVRPNLLQATGSYIVSDPKGNLYDLYARYLRGKGYRVERLDLADPGRSTVYYNLFHYLQDETDILRVAHLLNMTRPCEAADPFWEYTAELLLEACIAYLVEEGDPEMQTLSEVLALIRKGHRSERDARGDVSDLDRLMRIHKEDYPEGLATRSYESIAISPIRTWDSICVSASAKYGAYDTRELRNLMRKDTVRLEEIGQRPTAIFVVVSDTDRTMDALANLFISQALQVLCRVADAREDSRLPVPVRFILDDFATNVRIEEFPRMISSIRSRGISAMLMIQAEAQLRAGYGADDATIIGNCDTYVYLGGNDIETARRVGERCNRSMLDVLGMPMHCAWVCRRGEIARQLPVFDLESYETMRMEEAAADMQASWEPMSIAERQARREHIEQSRRERLEADAWEMMFDDLVIEEADADDEEVIDEDGEE